MSRLKPLRMLLVSDRGGVQDRLGAHLRRLGQQVEEAYQPGYALQLVRRGGLEVVLLDLALPGQDALGFLDRLGRLRPEISAVVIAGATLDQTLIQAVGLGAVEVLDRSLNREEVDAFLRRESLLRSLDFAAREGRPGGYRAGSALSPLQQALEAELKAICHPYYRGQSWRERTLEFCQAFDLVRRSRLYLLHTFFQQLSPRWEHPAWPLFDRARRQADALAADYREWVEAQFDRVRGQGRRDLSPADLQGRAAARGFRQRAD